MNELFYMQFCLKVLDIVKLAEQALTVSEYREFLKSEKKLFEEKLEKLNDITEE